MKNPLSLIACFIVVAMLLQLRSIYPEKDSGKPLNVTQWDAFGYYAYLPGMLIYHDMKQLDWINQTDKKYHVTGGNGWQAEHLENGNYVLKYLGGVAILELPFFMAGTIIAKQSGYPQDGFSAPYQYALAFGVIFYCLLAVLVLRNILLRYFADIAVAFSLLLVCLATNFTVYAAIDNGLSHVYIFLLYALVLYTTLQWHCKPKMIWAFLTGYIIGLATICRPTEAIMLFIPLLWGIQNKETAREKWKLVKNHRGHIVIIIIAGVLGIFPQLLYWKLVTGSFIYDVGSKWDFLLPHFRVLWGWEKGWFIYTPVTIFFIVGMWFIRRFPFQKSVIWFCILNIWIIISWHEWRYAASYSARALVESYPVFVLPLAAFIDRIRTMKWKWLLYPAAGYLLFLNYFQTRQYCDGIIHYDDMNRKYYAHIYLNPRPSAEVMSLLDTDEFLAHEDHYKKVIMLAPDSIHTAVCAANDSCVLIRKETSFPKDAWLKFEADIQAPGHLWQSYLHVTLQSDDMVKHTRIRLFNALSKDTGINRYAGYMKVPEAFTNGMISLYIKNDAGFEGSVKRARIAILAPR